MSRVTVVIATTPLVGASRRGSSVTHASLETT
jgi:hypothetical protein